MTFQFLTNQIPITNDAAMFQIKNFFVSANWTVVASSDGAFSYSNTNDLITHYGSGVNGLGNTNAYFVIKQYNTQRSFIFQRGPFDDGWRISYTATGFDVFPSNPIGNSDIPTSSTGDNNFVFGDNESGFNKYKTLFPQDNTYKLQICVDDSGGGAYFFCCTGEKNNPLVAFLFDPLISGSFSPSDTDPYVIYVGGKLSNAAFDLPDINTIDANCPFAWLQKDLPSAAFVRLVALTYNHPNSANFASTAVPNNVESSPYNQKDQFFPVIYARPNTMPSPTGYKGISSMMQWVGSTRGIIYPVGINAIGDSIVVNRVVLPWNNSALIL